MIGDLSDNINLWRGIFVSNSFASGKPAHMDPYTARACTAYSCHATKQIKGPYHYYTSSFQVMKYKQADLIRRIECFAMCKLISCDKLFKNETYYGGVMLVSGT